MIDTRESWLERIAARPEGDKFVIFRLKKILADNPTDGDDNVPREWAEFEARRRGLV